MTAIEYAITKYFANQQNFKMLKELNSNRQMQPRLIDFFMTQYSKASPQFFVHRVGGVYVGVADVYSSYKLQLKGFHKKAFNLFDKKKQKNIKYNNDFVEMSVPRLHVYKWLIDNDIHSLIKRNLGEIQAKYYEFRKSSLKQKCPRPKKRGKMNTFIKVPLIVKRVNTQKIK